MYTLKPIHAANQILCAPALPTFISNMKYNCARLIIEETSKAIDMHEPLSRSDLIDLYKHSWSVILAELGFCHQYLNFYSGLLSAILAATLAGLLSMKFKGLDEFA